MLGRNNSETPMVFCAAQRKTTKGGSLFSTFEFTALDCSELQLFG
jgi:hypothetical protein